MLIETPKVSKHFEDKKTLLINFNYDFYSKLVNRSTKTKLQSGKRGLHDIYFDSYTNYYI